MHNNGELTSDGNVMAEFPLDPQLSKLLCESPKHECANEMLSIAAMLSVPNCFVRPFKDAREADKAKLNFVHSEGDHLTLMNVYNGYKHHQGSRTFCTDNYLNPRSLASADNVLTQLKRTMERLGLGLKSLSHKEPRYMSNLQKCLVAGFFMQAAHQTRAGHYLTVKDNQVVALHPSCVLLNSPEWVIYNEFVLTSKNFIRTVSTVRPQWLLELAPNFYDLDDPDDFPEGEAKRKLLRARERAKNGDTTAGAQPWTLPTTSHTSRRPR
uniref:RNA helicase n=1 Tax=Lankesteria abbotti TaxID=340204 RepID=A0A7S2QR76_9APIC